MVDVVWDALVVFIEAKHEKLLLKKKIVSAR
jgi:hypothetical protein